MFTAIRTSLWKDAYILSYAIFLLFMILLLLGIIVFLFYISEEKINKEQKKKFWLEASILIVMFLSCLISCLIGIWFSLWEKKALEKSNLSTIENVK